VPEDWMGELRRSWISDFRPGIRTGAFINPTTNGTAWMNHIPCMLRANLPVYIGW
ncbi:hypothetical protein LXA43DRAFT_844648, partial [Ganoderma leucocontextum]